MTGGSIRMGVKAKEKIHGSGVWWVFINHNGRRKSKMVGAEKAHGRLLR
jgi:integrase